ncbi:MAG: FAD-dependent oxidoreductase [Planctomycetia bacterium]|nr:FAD-dependent oxidoreductase [Planctomycetia bacterium]
MKKFLGTLLCLAFLSYGMVWSAEKPVYDLVIYGGSSAGVSAAVQAKRMGYSAVIVCPDVHLGGLSSAGLGATDSGNRAVIGGISREFYHRLWKHYQNPQSWKWMEAPNLDIPGQGGRGFNNEDQTAWVFEPSAAEKVFEDFVREEEIPVFRGRYLDRKAVDKGVLKEGTRIVGIRMKNGEVYRGKMFVDATYEGDLLAMAGVSYTLGRESNAQYGETLNGIQVGHSYSHQFLGFVDPYVVPGDPKSGLLPYVNEDAGGADGEADDKLQAYCYRMCLTNVPENRVPFEKPENYRELDYELFLRSIEAGQTGFLIMSTMPNRKTDCNNYSAVSTDFIGANYNYPEASDEERLEIEKAHRQWQHGLMWTLQNHPRVPENFRKQYALWGLSKDESVDTGHWGHKIYVREGRRMVSDFVHTENHCRRILSVEKPIGFGSYQMDSHNCQRHVLELPDGRKTVRNEGDVQVSPGGAYPIDLGTILPKKSECTNLVVPVCVSSSHIAYGSIRMEPVFMILAQSAATVACMAIEENLAVQEVDYGKLAKKLQEDKQVIDYPLAPPKYAAVRVEHVKGLVMDDENPQVIRTGEWKSGNVVSPYVGAGYIHDDAQERGKKSVRYEIAVPEAKGYEVQISYSPLGNRATNVLVEIHTADGIQKVRVNQQKTPAVDGLFQSLGKFPFAGKAVVILRNDDADGHVIADTVRLLP